MGDSFLLELNTELLVLDINLHPLFALTVINNPPRGNVTLVLVYLEHRGFLHWNHQWLQHPPLPGSPTSLLMLVLDSKS